MSRAATKSASEDTTTGLTAVSLFSGAGGLDIGFERAGFTILFANEFDHDAANTWRANRRNSDVLVEGDINDHLNTLRQFAGKTEVLFGGPPCQGFSVAGKMDPNDERSQLIWTFLDAVAIVRPKVFVMENVKALASLDKWSDVRAGLVDRAEKLGYKVHYAVHHTAHYGVPQNRERVIFVGALHGDPHNFEQALTSRRAPAPSTREVLLSVGQFGCPENPQTCTTNVSLAKHPVMRRSPYAGMLVNGAGRPINFNAYPPTLPATMGGNKTPIIDQYALDHPETRNWFETYHDGLLAGDVAPTSTVVPAHLRRLTLAEAAAIQTFPREYVFCGPKSKQYKQIGNAVPACFAYAVATAVKDAFFNESSRP